MNKFIACALTFIISNITHAANASNNYPPASGIVLHHTSTYHSSEPAQGTVIRSTSRPTELNANPNQPSHLRNLTIIRIMPQPTETEHLYHPSHLERANSERTCREVTIIFFTVFSAIVIVTGVVYGIVSAAHNRYS